MARRRDRESDMDRDREFGYFTPRRYWASRVAPYAMEWAGMLLLLIVGAITHASLGTASALPFITPVLVLLGAVLAGVAWVAGRARGQITRVHAVVTIAAATVWLVGATVAGSGLELLVDALPFDMAWHAVKGLVLPIVAAAAAWRLLGARSGWFLLIAVVCLAWVLVSVRTWPVPVEDAESTPVGPRVMLLLWALGGATVCLSWNIRRALASGSDGTGGELFEKVKLAGVKAKAIEAAPNKVTAHLQLPPGELTVDDVQKAGDRLTGAMRLHNGAVRITGHPDDASQARMTVVPVDVLRTSPPWPGPSAPGRSIVEPLRLGLYEDNEPQLLHLPGDKTTGRQATHYMVVGMNGSGKSHMGIVAWTEILTRRDANLIILDPVKGKQTVGFLGTNSAHIVLGEKACQQFMTRVPAVITDRTNRLGGWGLDEWTPAAHLQYGMPYLVLWVEEATRVLEDADTLTKIAEAARSAGISLVLSLQKASFRRMSTDVRSQMGGAMCFGVKEIQDAEYSLSDHLIEAGVRPDRWANRRPGCNYLEAPGIDEDRLSMPGRTFNADRNDLLRTIRDAVIVRPALYAPTAALLGLPQHPGEAATVNQPANAPQPAGLDVDLDRMPPLSDADDIPVEIPPDPEPDLTATAETEFQEEDTAMDLPGGRPTRSEARRLLREHIDQLIARGKLEFTVRDLADPEVYGRSREWLSGELSRLADEGVLTRTGTDWRAHTYRVRAPDTRDVA